MRVMVWVRDRVSKFVTLRSASHEKCSRGECHTTVQMYAIISSSVWQVASVVRYQPQASPFAVRVWRDAMPRRTDIIAGFFCHFSLFFSREGADIRRCAQADQRSTVRQL